MTAKPDPVEAHNLEDYVTFLANAQYDQNRLRRWLLPAAVLLLGLGLGMEAWLGKLALCATLATLGYWLRAEIQWSGRYWFMHLVLKHTLVRPQPDLTTALLTALLEIDDAAQASQKARSSAMPGEGGMAEGDEADTRDSAASRAQEGHRGG